MAIVYAKTKRAKYAARTNCFNKIHISVPADRIVTGWLDMCYTMHYPELPLSLKYYEIICHYKVTNRDKIKAFCICWIDYVASLLRCNLLKHLISCHTGNDFFDAISSHSHDCIPIPSPFP